MSRKGKYNVGHPGYVCWFIYPIKYSLVKPTINHRIHLVSSTNLAILWAPLPCKFSEIATSSALHGAAVVLLTSRSLTANVPVKLKQREKQQSYESVSAN